MAVGVWVPRGIPPPERAAGQGLGSSAVLFFAACVRDRNRRVVMVACCRSSACLDANRGDVSSAGQRDRVGFARGSSRSAVGCEIRARCSAIAIRSLGVARCCAASFLPGPVAPGRLHGTRWWWGGPNLELEDPLTPASGAFQKQGTGRRQGAASAGVAAL